MEDKSCFLNCERNHSSFEFSFLDSLYIKASLQNVYSRKVFNIDRAIRNLTILKEFYTLMFLTKPLQSVLPVSAKRTTNILQSSITYSWPCIDTRLRQRKSSSIVCCYCRSWNMKSKVTGFSDTSRNVSLGTFLKFLEVIRNQGATSIM